MISTELQPADLKSNKIGVRQGGSGTYDGAQIAKRRKRAETMRLNNRPETEEKGEDSLAAVVAVLSNETLFPWIEDVEVEEDRLGDDDWEKKTDLYVNPAPEFYKYGLRDQYRIQVKSSWCDFSGLQADDIKKLLALTYREWQELGLVVLFGQATNESIAASFCNQIINHMEIARIKQARGLFTAFQTPELLTMMCHYDAIDIAGRDWARLLYWIATGRTKREERGVGGGKVVFL